MKNQDENHHQILMDGNSINPGQIGEGLINASPINAFGL
jgi:hypothetical protein|tara:strand:+ start:330 stop:446 length:117 start_codon:yes stop_codon:yes gene_type:complete